MSFLSLLKRVSRKSVLWILLLFFISACQSMRVQTRSGGTTPTTPKTAQPGSPQQSSDGQELAEPEDEPVPQRVAEPPRIGLILGPGYLRAYAHAGVVQELFRSQIPVHAVTGIESGSLVAALYSHKGQAFDVEWQMMKLRDSDWLNTGVLGGARPQDISSFNRFFNEVFAGANIESGKLPFACPVLHLSRQQVARIQRGKYVDALRLCMLHAPEFKSQSGVVAATTDLDQSIEFLKAMGANHIVFIDVSSGRIPADKAYWGLYRHALLRQAKAVDYILTVNLENIDFNDFEKRREMIKRGQTAGKAAAADLIKKLGL